MAPLNVSQCLGLLLEDPDDIRAFDGLLDAWTSGDASRLGDDPLTLMAHARRGHLDRGEIATAAKLLEVEALASEEDPDREAALLVELAKLRDELLLDAAGARQALERAKQLRPGDSAIASALSELSEIEANWKAISKRFVDQAKDSDDDILRASLLVHAAALLWKFERGARATESDALFEEALSLVPGDVRANLLFEETLRERSMWPAACERLLLASGATSNKDDKCAFALRAARLLSRKLSAPARAAEAYERVLELESGHEEAMGFLVSYYTEASDWDRLVRVYESALRNRSRVENEAGALLQLAMVHWRMRGQPADAEPFFARLRKHDPAHPAMLDFYREYLTQTGDEAKLLAILGDAQRMSSDAGKKIRLALEVARAAMENPATLERSIDAWKAVQRIDATNEEAHRALLDLYRRAAKWNGLVDALKLELDRLEPSENDRRVEILRELVSVYRDELKLDAMVVTAYAALLSALPDDVEAFDALASLYESLGRWNDLIQLLSKRVEVTSDVSEKCALLMRVAKLWIDRFQNHNQAMKPLEQLLELDPEEREALGMLREIYGKKRAWQPLFDVLSREVELMSDPSARIANLTELAKIAGERLHKNADAISLWRRIVDEDPETPGALAALEKLTEREKDWSTLASVLELRVDRAPEAQEKIKLLQRLGGLYLDELADAGKSVDAWRRVLEIEPRNGKAVRTLREHFLESKNYDALEELYSEHSDWEGLVEALGVAADRAADVDTKILLSLRAAEIFETVIGEPARAFRAYERVLGVDAKNVVALKALARIHESEEKWSKLEPVLLTWLETLGETDETRDERLEIFDKLYGIATDAHRDPARALGWAKRAYDLDPESDDRFATIESAALRANAYAELAAIYEARAQSGLDSPESLRKLAVLAEEHLGDLALATSAWKRLDALDAGDETASMALDRLYRTTGDSASLRDLLRARAERGTNDDERFAIFAELARLEENAFKNDAAAVDAYRAMLEIRPGDAELLSSLERFATKAEKWDEVVELVTQRIDGARSENERFELELHLANIYAQKLNDAGAALDAIERVLDESPTESSAVAALEALKLADASAISRASEILERAYLAKAAWPSLVALLRTRRDRTSDAFEKRELELRIADLQAGELGDAKGAYATLEAVFLGSPGEREIWDRVEAMAERAGQFEALAAAYGTAAELAVDDGTLAADDALELQRRAARIFSDLIGDQAKAEPFHRRVLIAEPLDDAAFAALKELYTNGERWAELEEIYRARIEAADAPQQVDLLLQLCFVFEEILDDVAKATAAYEAVREIDPRSEAATHALEKLYRKAGKHEQLAALLDGIVDDLSGPERLERLYELGALREQLGDEGAAVERYESILSESPAHLRAQEALDRFLANATYRERVALLLEPVYEGQGAWRELARVLDVLLAVASSASERNAIRLRLAEIYETRLDDAKRAFASLSEALFDDLDDALIRAELARVASMAGLGEQRASVLEKAAAKASSPSLRAEILYELGTLLDVELGVSAKAEVPFAALLELRDAEPNLALSAARSLEPIYRAKNDLAKLAEAYRARVTLEESEDERQRIRELLANLLELELNRDDEALAVREEQLDVDSTHRVALDASLRILSRRGAWLEAADVLERLAGVSESGDERRAFAMSRAAMLADRAGDLDAATRAYEDVLADFGRAHDVLDALAVRYTKGESWDALFDTLVAKSELLAAEGASLEERAAARHAEAELLRLHLSRNEDAVEAYRDALDLLPTYAPSRAALEALLVSEDRALALEAARVLEPRAEAQDRVDDRLAALRVLADSEDLDEALTALRRIADVEESRRGDLAKAFAANERAIVLAPEGADVGTLLREMERLALADGRKKALAESFALLADTVGSDEDREFAWKRSGEIFEEEGDFVSARASFERYREVSPDSPDALEALDRVLGELGDLEALAEVIESRANLEAEPARRAELALRRGRTLVRVASRREDAVSAFESAMEESDGEEAYLALAELLTSLEKWDDLGFLYERKIERGIGDVYASHQRLAEVLLDHSADVSRAIDELRAAAEHDPVFSETVARLEGLLTNADVRSAAAETLEGIYLARLDWANVVRVLEVRIEAEDDSHEKKAHFAKLASYHEEQRDDARAAYSAYERWLSLDASDEAPFEALLRLTNAANTKDAWARFGDTVELRVAEGDVDPASSFRLLKTLGRVSDENLGDLARSSRAFERALEAEPDDVESFDALESLYTRRSANDELAALYRRRADAAPDDDTRVEMLRRLGAIEVGVRRRAADAVEIYREILSVIPSDERALSSLDELLLGLARREELADVLRTRIEFATDEPSRTALSLRLASLLSNEMSDVPGALDVYEQVFADSPANAHVVTALEVLVKGEPERARIIEMLAPIYASSGEWDKLVAVYEAKLLLLDDAFDQAVLLGEIGNLHEDHRHDISLAFSAWSRSLFAYPASDDARHSLERLAISHELWAELTATYEHALTLADDESTEVQLLLRLAHIHDERRGDPRKSIETYDRLAALLPDDPAPLEALESLHTMVGDWTGLVRVLAIKVERGHDSVERGELRRRAASVYEELLSDEHGAIEAYRAALDEDANDELALEALDRLYTRSGNSTALVDVLRRRIELAQTTEERVAYGLRLGGLLEQTLRIPADACEAFERVLDDDPFETIALKALARLYELESRWSDLLENLRIQAEHADSTKRRVELLDRAASLLASQLDDVGAAFEMRRDILTLEPGHSPTLDALRRFAMLEPHRVDAVTLLEPELRSLGAYGELAMLLEQKILVLHDPREQHDELRRLAELYEGTLDKPARAVEALLQAIRLEPSDLEAASEAERVARSVKSWDVLVTSFVDIGVTALDPTEGRELATRAARIAEEELADPARALEIYRRALDIVADDVEILDAVDRLAVALERWEIVGDVLERQLSLVTDPAREIALLSRRALFELRHHNNAPAALSTLRDVLDRDPREASSLALLDELITNESVAFEALELLEDVCRSTDNQVGLARVVERKADLAASDVERVRLLIESARILEGAYDASGATDSTILSSAAVLYARAAKLDPEQTALLDDLEAIVSRSGDATPLDGLVEAIVDRSSLDRTTRAALHLRAARWYADRLADPTKAEARYRSSLQLDEHNEEVHSELIALLRAFPDRSRDLADALRAAALSVPGGDVASLWREAAERYDADGMSTRAIEAWESLLNAEPGDAAALSALVRLESAAGNHRKMADWLALAAEHETDDAARRGRLVELAKVRGESLGDPQGAIAALEEVLKLDDGDLAALTALESLLEATSRWSDLRDTLERKLAHEPDASARYMARLRIAALSESKLGAADAAVESLESAIAEAPERAEAWDLLELIHERKADPNALAETLERRLESEFSLDREAALRTATKLAKARETLGDAQGAERALRRRLELDASDIATRRELVRILENESLFAEAFDELLSLIPLLSGADVQATALRASTLAETSLEDVGRAEQALRLALASDAADAKVRDRLVALLESHGEWTRLLTFLEESLASAPDANERGKLLRRLALIARENLGDAARAANYLEQAAQLSPEDREILLPLCDLYTEAGRAVDAIPVLERIIASYGTRRAKELALYQHRLGLALEGMGDRDGALRHLDAAFKIDLTNVQILRDLGRLTYELGDWDRAQKTYRALLLQKLDASSGITKADVYYHLGEISVQQGDVPKGLGMFDRALAEDREHAKARARATELRGG